MKSQMANKVEKSKAKLPLLAMFVALAALAITVPAEARSTTGWNSFRGHGVNSSSWLSTLPERTL